MNTAQLFVAAPLAVVLIATPVFAPSAIDLSHLFQHWVRSYEEEQPGQAVQVFRPANSKAFPPSRFRLAYKFARNGSCERFVLSPDDAHSFEACAWSISASDRTQLQITGHGSTSSFKIVDLSEQRLRLEPFE